MIDDNTYNFNIQYLSNKLNGYRSYVTGEHNPHPSASIEYEHWQEVYTEAKNDWLIKNKDAEHKDSSEEFDNGECGICKKVAMLESGLCESYFNYGPRDEPLDVEEFRADLVELRQEIEDLRGELRKHVGELDY